MKHLTEQELSGYASRTLGVQESLQVDDHLTSCLKCCVKLQSVLQANTGGSEAVNSIAWELTAQDTDFHLSFEQIVAFLAAPLDEVEHEIITSHIALCANCLAEIEDLRVFKQLLAEQIAFQATAPFPIVSASKKKDRGKFFRSGATR